MEEGKFHPESQGTWQGFVHDFSLLHSHFIRSESIPCYSSCLLSSWASFPIRLWAPWGQDLRCLVPCYTLSALHSACMLNTFFLADYDLFSHLAGDITFFVRREKMYTSEENILKRFKEIKMCHQYFVLFLYILQSYQKYISLMWRMILFIFIR